VTRLAVSSRFSAELALKAVSTSSTIERFAADIARPERIRTAVLGGGERYPQYLNDA
jgi:hypothetical protein